MADLIGPFDDAPWSQDQWYRFASMWAPSGVIGPASSSVTTGSFGVTASGLSLSVATGRYWVRGSGFEPEAVTVKAVTANANVSLSRRDRLVVRRDLAAATITLEVKAGTASATPTAPSLTQSETGTWEAPVCSFLVPPNSATTLSSFTDERPWIDGEGDNAGNVGAIVGSIPPPGTRLLTKTLKQQVVTDGSGVGTATYPGGAFPNGVLSVHPTTATAQPFFWVVHSSGNTLSQVSLLGYNITTGTVAGSLSIATTITATGW